MPYSNQNAIALREADYPLLHLKEQIANFEPYDAQEAADKDKMLEALDTGISIFSRKTLSGHFTGSAILVDVAARKVLLNHHKFLNLWLFFGGHIDPGETAFEAAIRECTEESSVSSADFFPFTDDILDLGVHVIPDRPQKSEPSHTHYDVMYAFQTDSTLPLKVSNESADIRWCDFDEAKNLVAVDYRAVRCIEKIESILGPKYERNHIFFCHPAKPHSDAGMLACRQKLA